MKNTLDPTTIVLFGGSGDLAQKKLFPALYDLYLRGKLPDIFQIVGVSRTKRTDEEYRLFIKGVLDMNKCNDLNNCDEFLNNCHFVEGTIGEEKMCDDLRISLDSLDKERGICTNKMFYLAIPPKLYEPVFKHLKSSGLSIACGKDFWTRVLVEKPFGYDREEAMRLDSLLGKLFEEEQIFRIDHYLAKETVQNIITFRFANSIFEPLLNSEYVDEINIRMFETIDADSRGAFYDGIGALRDVGQNHLLQLLAITTMDSPEELTAEAVRKEREKLLRSVVHPKIELEQIARGQYAGFKNVAGVSPDSKTETYFKFKTEIKNSRWSGVPITIEAGKALKDKKVEVEVVFKETVSCVCPPGDFNHKNSILFSIQPDEGINMRFWAKKPGFEHQLEPKELSFCYNYKDLVEEIPDAYERVLFDCIRGDQMLFTSTKEVEAQWDIIMPILDSWGNIPLYIYEKGESPDEIIK